MKKICFLVNNISEVGGLQRVISVVTNELSKIDNYKVFILFTGPSNIVRNIYYPLNPEIEIIINENLTWGKYDNLIPRLLAKFQNKVNFIKNPDILQRMYYPKNKVEKFQSFFNDENFDIVVGVTPQLSGLLSLLEIDGTKLGWFHSTYERYFNYDNSVLKNTHLLYEKILPKLDNIIVLTDYDKQIYSKKFHVNCTRIYNPISFTVKKKSDLGNSNIIFVGRLFNQTKGLDLLLSSLKILRDRNPNFNLIIVGDGPDKEKFFKEARKLNLLNNITFKGYQQNVEKYYLESSVCVVPSRVEGFGLVIIEAMEAGLPVISYKTEGPSEIITDSMDGFLINKYDTEDFAKKINYLITQKEIRLSMGKNASLKARNFSLWKIIDEWKKLFDKLA